MAKWPISGWYGQSVVNKPYLAVAGNRVYVTDPEGYRVLVFDTDGKFVATFGEYGFDSKTFALPTGIAVDGEGNVYVTDSANHRVMKFAPMSQ
jgi:DNA-binding beta-propeller fold protein YncE